MFSVLVSSYLMMSVWKVWISEANCVRGLSALTRECVNNNYDSLYWGRQPNICPPPPPDNVPCTVYCVMHCTVQIVEMCQTGKLSNWFLRPRRIAVTGDLFSGNNECLYLPYPRDSICRTKILIGYSGTSIRFSGLAKSMHLASCSCTRGARENCTDFLLRAELCVWFIVWKLPPYFLFWR